MPKRNKSKSKRMRGGFDMSSLNPFNPSKENANEEKGTMSGWLSGLTGSNGSTSSTDSTSDTGSTTSYNPTSGGRRRKMRGGYSYSASYSNLASNAGSFSGGKRTKKRCHKRKGTRKRNCRK